MAKKDEDIFFVEVSQPNEVKREILESLKGILENMHRFEKFKEARQAKLDKISSLSKTMRDLNKQLNALKAIFPESKLRAIDLGPSGKQSSKKVKSKKVTKQRPSEPRGVKPTTELDKLTSELAAIEEKLKGLE